MADNYIKIKIRRGNSADWVKEDPLLDLGEIAADLDKHLLKVGNGVSHWSALPYYSLGVVDNLEDGGTDKALSAEQGKELKELIDDKADSSELRTLETTLRELIRDKDIDIIDKMASVRSTTRADAALSANQGRLLWEAIDDIPTSAGQPGQAATIEIGNVATGESGTQAKVENVGTKSAAKLNFTIPRGADGANGVTPTIKAGTVTTLPAGSNAEVSATTSGTTTTFSFKIPKGDTGAGGSGSSVELVNDLEHTDTDKALTANQGKVLGDKIKGMGIFGMGYTVTKFTKTFDKPEEITFEDGVTCTLIWDGSRLNRIVASTGERIFIDYDDYGKIIGRRVERS